MVTTIHLAKGGVEGGRRRILHNGDGSEERERRGGMLILRR